MSDRIRAAVRENHRIHDCDQQDPAASYEYLTADQGEIEELAVALAAWMSAPGPVTEALVVTEVADCLIILDWILDKVTRGEVTAVAAVEAKVAADRVKHGTAS